MGIKVREGGAWVEVSSGGGSGGSSDPVGTIVAWAGSVATIPSEYQLCDGSAASTSALQAITGANVPDLRDRFIVGANNVSGTGTYPGVGVGSTGGAATHTLTVAEIPSHNHGTNPNNTATMTVGDGAYNIPQYGGANNTGGGQPHNNLPPYYALCYIIKHTATSGSGGGVTSTWTLGANGSSHYTFTGPGGLSNTDDPKIYLARGQTYEFVNNSGGSHPFQIQQSNGSAYSTGVTNNGASSGTIRFEVPFSTPNTLQYKCTSHGSMGNTIIIYPDLSP